MSTSKEGIFKTPYESGIKVQEIDLEEDFSPFINLYSLPIFGPAIIEKKFSNDDISIIGFSSVSFILIV